MGTEHTNGHRYISGAEAARLLGMTPQGIGQLGRRGLIGRKEGDGCYLFRATDVEKIARKNGIELPPQPEERQLELLDAKPLSEAAIAAAIASTKPSVEVETLAKIKRYIALSDKGLAADEILTLIRSAL